MEKDFPMRKQERFYPKGEELSSQGEGNAVHREWELCAQVKEKLSVGKLTSVRRRKNFRAQGGKFPCGRKYFFVRTEIYLLPQENLPNLAERSNALFNNKLIYHDQDQSC